MNYTYYCWAKLHIISFLLKEFSIFLITFFLLLELSLSTLSSLNQIREQIWTSSVAIENNVAKIQLRWGPCDPQMQWETMWAHSFCVWGTEITAYSSCNSSDECSFSIVGGCQYKCHAWTINELDYQINLSPWIIVPLPCGLIQFAVIWKGITDVGKVDIFFRKDQRRVLVSGRRTTNPSWSQPQAFLLLFFFFFGGFSDPKTNSIVYHI